MVGVDMSDKVALPMLQECGFSVTHLLKSTSREVVLKAFQRRNSISEQQVVVKGISIHDLDYAERSDTLAEVNALRNLAAHPNVIKHTENFVDDSSNMLFLVMECAQDNLRTVISASQASRCYFADQTIVRWMQHAALGLQHLHSHGVVHANLKPSTMFLSRGRERLSLGSCGISPLQMRKAFDRLPDDNGAAYLSPEAMQNQSYESHSDMWALGCVLFELSTLHVAFNGHSLLDFALQVIEGEPNWDLWNSASAVFLDITKRLLEKPSARRPSAAELLTEPLLARSLGNANSPICHVDIVSPKAFSLNSPEAKGLHPWTPFEPYGPEGITPDKASLNIGRRASLIHDAEHDLSSAKNFAPAAPLDRKKQLLVELQAAGFLAVASSPAA